jgi:hypothetical protein
MLHIAEYTFRNPFSVQGGWGRAQRAPGKMAFWGLTSFHHSHSSQRVLKEEGRLWRAICGRLISP